MSREQFSAFKRFAKSHGLKSTAQRDQIVQTFLKCKGHLSVEDLHHRVQKAHPKIGYVTVYRTMKLLAESGLAAARRFEDGQTRYEQQKPEEHHDHLICLGCGAIFEFEDERIEKLQEEIAQASKFRVVDHKLELYGYCSECDNKEKP